MFMGLAWTHTCIQVTFLINVNPNGGGGVDCTQTFFQTTIFLNEKRDLEALNFVTFRKA